VVWLRGDGRAVAVLKVSSGAKGEDSKAGKVVSSRQAGRARGWGGTQRC
jgi:hypothetical protein